MQFAFPGWSESKEEEIKHPPKRQRHRQEKKGSPQSSQSVSNFNSRPRPIILSEQEKIKRMVSNFISQSGKKRATIEKERDVNQGTTELRKPREDDAVSTSTLKKKKIQQK